MPLNQMNENLNDAFEVYFPKMGKVEGVAHRITTSLVARGFRLRNRLFRGSLLLNERIVEYPVILQWIKPEGKVLDIGCVSSRMPIQLASLGYEVHGLDARAYGFNHPNFKFHNADLFNWVPEEKYNIILLVSVIEHFGLGGYGDLIMPEADKEAVALISTWLTPGGQLLVSLPFGKPEITPKHRIYDRARLKHVFSDLEWVRQKYFVRKEGAWFPGDVEVVESVASSELPVNGVAILDFRLKASSSE